MKKKLFLTVLAVALSVAMVAAATMAWFTDEATAGNAIFTAGTVDVSVEDDADFTVNENWNPGDADDVKWTITNNGSKRIVFRIEPEAEWRVPNNAPADIALSLDNITLKFKIGDKIIDPRNPENGNVYPWLVVGNGSNINDYIIYYIGKPLETGKSVDLDLQVLIDGPNTNNNYQGATFTLGGTVEAVQASNGAPNDLWQVNHYDYLKAEVMPMDYITTRPQYERFYAENDGTINISLPELTVGNGFSIKNGKALYPEFNYTINSSGAYDTAWVPVLIDLQQFPGKTVDRVVASGANIDKIIANPSDLPGGDYLYYNVKVAANMKSPANGALLTDWIRTPKTNNTVFVYFTDGTVFTFNVNYSY